VLNNREPGKVPATNMHPLSENPMGGMNIHRNIQNPPQCQNKDCQTTQIAISAYAFSKTYTQIGQFTRRHYRTRMPSTLIRLILIFNGTYDVACAVSLLWLGGVCGFRTLSLLHVDMWDCEARKVCGLGRRLLAYWILTYGVVRLAAGLRSDGVHDGLAALTYWIEGLCFEHEIRVDSFRNVWKMRFTSLCSVALGFVVWNPVDTKF